MKHALCFSRLDEISHPNEEKKRQNIRDLSSNTEVNQQTPFLERRWKSPSETGTPWREKISCLQMLRLSKCSSVSYGSVIGTVSVSLGSSRSDDDCPIVLRLFLSSWSLCKHVHDSSSPGVCRRLSLTTLLWLILFLIDDCLCASSSCSLLILQLDYFEHALILDLLCV